MFFLILLVVVFGVIGFFVWRIWKQRSIEAALRENPPEHVCFEVTLPPDAEASNQLMARFWDRIHRHLPADEESMQKNTNTLHCAVVGTGAQPGIAPRVHFLVWCHPSIADKVQLDLTECYNDDLSMLTVEGDKDPFAEWMVLYREGIAYQKAVAASSSSDDDDDDD